MNEWKVYCYTGKNGKKYIGITSFNLVQRAGKNGKNYSRDKNSAFGNAIQKYGFDFFISEILENNLTKEEACKLEKYYIDLYDTYENGYNCSLGGEGNSKFDKEQILSLWNSGKNVGEICNIVGCKNITVQRVLTSFSIEGKERIKRSAGNYHIVKVYKYDLEGNFLQEYNSYSEAEKINNIPHGNIAKCVKGERKSAGGFIWSDKKLEKNKSYEKAMGYHKELYQYDLEKNMIKKYSSVAEAGRMNKYLPQYLSRAARTGIKAYGYYWSYNETVC